MTLKQNPNNREKKKKNLNNPRVPLDGSMFHIDVPALNNQPKLP